MTQEFDVVVIGGGATGLGVAVEAASRSLKIYDAESNADNYHHFSIAPEHMYFDYSAGKDYKVRILYKMLSLEKKEESDSLSINEIDCFLLVKKMN